MTKHSDPPSGIYVPQKWVIIMICAFLGTGAGGLGLSNLLKGSDAAASSHKSVDDTSNDKFNIRFEGIETGVADNKKSITAVKSTVGQIQKVQHNQIARKEARRVTVDIPNKKRRLEMEDRIFEINLGRLKDKNKGTPCLDRTCSN